MKLSDLDEVKKVGAELRRWKEVRDLLDTGYTARLTVNNGSLEIDKDQASIIAEKYIAAARIKLSEMGVEE